MLMHETTCVIPIVSIGNDSKDLEVQRSVDKLRRNKKSLHVLNTVKEGFVVVFVFYVPPTAKVIWRRGHSSKFHPTDWEAGNRT